MTARQYNTREDQMCAECFQYKAMPMGERSDRDYELVLDTTVTLTCAGMDDIVIARRRRNKTAHYHRMFLATFGFIDELSSPYASFPDTCGDATEFETDGSYANNLSWLDTEIRFADLRTGTIFMRQDSGTFTGDAKNDNWIGEVLASGGFMGGLESCQTITARDAVGLKFTYASNHVVTETLVKPNRDISTSTATTAIPYAVAASDHSGYCGGLAVGCVGWGGYSVIDQTKAYDCSKGIFTEEYSVEDIESYYMVWENTQPRYRLLDNADGAIMSQFWGETAAATVDYVLPLVVVSALPKSSLAHDVSDNVLYSIKALDDKIHNELITSADTVEKITQAPLGSTFYPIAPV